MIDTMATLKDCEILGGLDDAMLAKLAEAAGPRTFSLGDTIFDAGDQRLEFWLLVSGQVEVRVEAGDGGGLKLKAEDVEAGRLIEDQADLVVLGADPLAGVENLSAIERVFVEGSEVYSAAGWHRGQR